MYEDGRGYRLTSIVALPELKSVALPTQVLNLQPWDSKFFILASDLLGCTMSQNKVAPVFLLLLLLFLA